MPVGLAILALAAPAEAAPRLGAPWDQVDFRGSRDRAIAQLGAVTLDVPCHGYGAYTVAGSCVAINDQFPDLSIEVQFPSIAAARKQLASAWGRPAFRTGSAEDWALHWHLRAGERRVLASLEPYLGGGRITLQELIPLATFVSGKAPDGIGTLLGMTRAALIASFGARAVCGAGEVCTLNLPAAESARTPVFPELDAGDVVQRVHYIVWCGGPCLNSRVFRSYASQLGRPAVSRQGTRVTFARAPRFVFDVRGEDGTWATMCTGRCDD